MKPILSCMVIFFALQTSLCGMTAVPDEVPDIEMQEIQEIQEIEEKAGEAKTFHLNPKFAKLRISIGDAKDVKDNSPKRLWWIDLEDEHLNDPRKFVALLEKMLMDIADRRQDITPETLSREIKKAGIDVNAIIDRDKSTPLHCAALQGYKSVVKTILLAGGKVNARDIQLNTPLHKAVLSESQEVCQLLIDHKADPKARNQCGYTPLDIRINHDPTGISGIIADAEVRQITRPRCGSSLLKEVPLRRVASV